MLYFHISIFSDTSNILIVIRACLLTLKGGMGMPRKFLLCQPYPDASTARDWIDCRYPSPAQNHRVHSSHLEADRIAAETGGLCRAGQWGPGCCRSTRERGRGCGPVERSRSEIGRTAPRAADVSCRKLCIDLRYSVLSETACLDDEPIPSRRKTATGSFGVGDSITSRRHRGSELLARSLAGKSSLKCLDPYNFYRI